jgi:hypothetical protein
MKPFLLTYILLLNFIEAYPQLKVDAGSDTVICYSFIIRNERLRLGGNPTATGGTEPYNYTWSGKLKFGDWIFASDLLDDTTSSNPLTKSIFDLPDKCFTFYLKVEDAEGRIGYDSVKISNSIFGVHPIYKNPVTIHKGDSVKLFGDIYFDNNFLPLTYTLSPSHGLTDPTNLYGWAKPDTSITYYLQAVNSVGCISGKEEYWRINVDTTTALNNIAAKPEIQCCLYQGNLIVNMPEINTSPYILTLATTDGKIIHSGKYNDPFLRLSNLGLKQNQIYVATILNKGEKSVFKLANNFLY